MPTARQQKRLADAWQDDLATLTDAVVRISRILERVLQMIEEDRAAEAADKKGADACAQ